jgi:SAM-dependent methyltransferase
MIIFVFLAWALAVDDYEALYNKYHQSRGPNACWGCGVLPFVYKMFPRSSTIVDAGAGSCTVVRALTQQGYNASGVEIFAYPVEHFCTDLRSVVRVSPLHTLPFFRDDEFDVVFSTEVLEHVPEDKIDDTIRELARVGRRFFITVGLSPDSEDHEGASLKFHATVRSSQWWSDKFSQFGLVRDELLWLLFMTHKDEVKAQQVPCSVRVRLLSVLLLWKRSTVSHVISDEEGSRTAEQGADHWQRPLCAALETFSASVHRSR